MVAILNLGLATGNSIVVVPKFELVPFLEVIQKYKVSWAHLVPPIILALAKHPMVSKYDISSLRSVVSGAAPLGAELQQEVMDKLKIPVSLSRPYWLRNVLMTDLRNVIRSVKVMV